MKKSQPARKTQMEETQLTDPEMDAALQLIQLSGDSAESAGAKTVEQTPEESIGDSNEISSDLKNKQLRPRKKKKKKRLRLIDDLYSITKPVIEKRGKKSVN